MGENLSIIAANQEPNIETNKSDVTASIAKGILNLVPHIGGTLAEVVSTIIPNQKIDRLIIFAKVLDDKVKYIEEDVLKVKMKTEEFTDLLEDGLIQASRAMSDERREYIASLLKNSLTNEELTHIGEKKLLALLGELNDAEILFLKYYSLHVGEQRTFAEEHKELFTPINRAIGAPQENFDKGALRDSYRSKLMEVGVLEPAYQNFKKGEVPEFDQRTGRPKTNNYRVNSLGKVLLRYIDLMESENPRQKPASS